MTVSFFSLFTSGVVVSLILGRLFIASSDRFRSLVRPLTPQAHQLKNNTPTMGGLFILAAVVLVAGASCLLPDAPVAIGVLALFLFGIIGGYDDIQKIRRGTGISASGKFIAQWLSAALILCCMIYTQIIPTTVVVPFLNLHIHLGKWYALWGSFIIVACSNAVNLTDGLDGLAASCLLPNCILFVFIGATSHIPMAYFSCIMAAALCGFLWFNRFPARVFMGDVGALALGAWYGYCALVFKIELLIPVAGIIFFAEELSVMAQVMWYKRFKTRLFKMAPLHHHFELSGWHEKKITLLSALVTTVGCLIAYAITRA